MLWKGKSHVAKEKSGRGRRRSREKGNQGVGDFRSIISTIFFFNYFTLSLFSILCLPTIFTHTHTHDPRPLPTTHTHDILLHSISWSVFPIIRSKGPTIWKVMGRVGNVRPAWSFFFWKHFPCTDFFYFFAWIFFRVIWRAWIVFLLIFSRANIFLYFARLSPLHPRDKVSNGPSLIWSLVCLDLLSRETYAKHRVGVRAFLPAIPNLWLLLVIIN